MAWVNIETSYDWGSSPHIYVTTDYEQYRDGANMYYRINASVYIKNGSTYNYEISADFAIDGTTKESFVLKAASSSNGTFTYTSSWYALTKTTGTTTVAVNYVGKGSPWRYHTGSASPAVEPAGSIFGTVSNFNLEDTFSFPVTKYSESFVDTLDIKIGDTTIKTVTDYTNNSNVHMENSELLSAYGIVDSQSTSSNISLVLTTNSGATVVGTDTKTVVGTIEGTGHINVGGSTWKRTVPWVKVNGVWKRAIELGNQTSVWKRGQ